MTGSVREHKSNAAWRTKIIPREGLHPGNKAGPCLPGVGAGSDPSGVFLILLQALARAEMEGLISFHQLVGQFCGDKHAAHGIAGGLACFYRLTASSRRVACVLRRSLACPEDRSQDPPQQPTDNDHDYQVEQIGKQSQHGLRNSSAPDTGGQRISAWAKIRKRNCRRHSPYPSSPRDRGNWDCACAICRTWHARRRGCESLPGSR